MKLKKTLVGALALCLAMGAADAMAENKMTGGDEPVKSAETTVQMTIDPTLDKYTITIPSSVTIFFPSTRAASVLQESTGRPFTKTVHRPQFAVSHPLFTL